MVDIMKYNKTRLNELSKNIMDCNGDYRLFCIDVDDVLFDVAPLVQAILERIDYRATNKYREEIIRETPRDSQDGFKMSYTILDAILEESKCVVEKDNGQKEALDFAKPLIDYEQLYSNENLFPGAVEFVNYMLKNKSFNDFFIFVSHRNPEREGVIKTRRLYELFPGIDGVITLPFHEKVGSSKMNDKGLWVMQTLLLENLDNAILIDNSKTNGKNWRNRNGIDIRYLPEGFSDKHSITDHLSKLTNMDPHMIQFALSFIEFARKYPEYPAVLEENNRVDIYTPIDNNKYGQNSNIEGFISNCDTSEKKEQNNNVNYILETSNKKEKITAEQSVFDMIMTMSEGNPGAMNVIMQMLENPRSLLDVFLCDSLDIRGYKIYMLYNDCCERNEDKFNRTLMMLRCGVFSEQQIQENLNLVRAIPFIDDNIIIDGVPSYGNDFGPTDEKWEEFCAKNKDIFTQKLNEILGQQNKIKIKGPKF